MNDELDALSNKLPELDELIDRKLGELGYNDMDAVRKRMADTHLPNQDWGAAWAPRCHEPGCEETSYFDGFDHFIQKMVRLHINTGLTQMMDVPICRTHVNELRVSNNLEPI